MRVVMVSSMTHYGGRLQWGDLQHEARYVPFQAYADSKLMNVIAARELQRRCGGLGYAVLMRCNVLWCWFFQSAVCCCTCMAVCCHGIVVENIIVAQIIMHVHCQAACDSLSIPLCRDSAVSVHPGLVDTALARGYFEGLVPGLLRPLLRVVFPVLLRTPASAAKTVVYAATAPELAGAYVSDGAVHTPAGLARDVQAAKRLWDVSCELVGTDSIVDDHNHSR